MRMTQSVFTVLVAVLLYLVSLGPALATEAKATAWVNVRSGPGTSYSVLDTMAPGETGTITECQGSWCHVQRSGPDGWVSQSYLTATETPPSDPDCSFQLVLGPSGPVFSLVCGDGGAAVPVPVPVPTPGTNRVCFYKGANYTGQRFCRQAGTYNHMPAGFNNSVSSVRLFGSARARICEFANQGPFCRNVNSSDTQLGGMLNNKVSSFRVVNGPIGPFKQACLFDGANYGGAHVCYGVGTRTLPPAAQNKASSVRLYGGAAARLSKSAIYGIGGAYYITTNKPILPPSWNNKTKSLRVE